MSVCFVPLTKVSKSTGVRQATYKVAVSTNFREDDQILRDISFLRTVSLFFSRLINTCHYVHSNSRVII